MFWSNAVPLAIASDAWMAGPLASTTARGRRAEPGGHRTEGQRVLHTGENPFRSWSPSACSAAACSGTKASEKSNMAICRVLVRYRKLERHRLLPPNSSRSEAPSLAPSRAPP